MDFPRVQYWDQYYFCCTSTFARICANANLDPYADDTIIPVVNAEIKVLALKTALVMIQLKAWSFDSEKLRGFSPRANYTDRAAAAGRRS